MWEALLSLWVRVHTVWSIRITKIWFSTGKSLIFLKICSAVSLCSNDDVITGSEKNLLHLTQLNASFLFGSSNASSNHLIVRRSCHTLCTWMVSLLCGSSHVPLNDISGVCFLSCIFKALGSEKLLLHLVHVNSLSPVWIHLCILKSLDCEKILSLFVHLNGFSPVWVLSCAF